MQIKIPKYKKPNLPKNGPKLMSPLDARKYNAGQKGIDMTGMYKDGFFINNPKNKKKLNQINANIMKVMSGEGY